MKKTIKLSHILKPIYYCAFAILLEVINFAWLNLTTSGGQVLLFPTYFALDLMMIFIVAALIFVSPNWLANVFLYLFLGAQMVLNAVNATIYKIFGDVFYFEMIALGAEGAEAFRIDFLDYWNIILHLAILAIVICLQVVHDKKLKKQISLKKLGATSLKVVCCVLLIVVSTCGFYTQTRCFAQSKEENRVFESDAYLWNNNQFKLESYKKFGSFGFYYKNIANMIYRTDELSSSEKEEIKQQLTQNNTAINTSAQLYGDNLIMIMLESFEWFAIDPYNTPTLWDIKTNSGVAFENFYSKNKTNISESIAILGNIMSNTTLSELAHNTHLSTPYNLPNMFKELGYTSNYFHSYKKTFYERNVVNSAMGFENVYGIEDAEIENKSTAFNDWNLDSDYISSMIDEFIPTDNKFFSFYTTVTTHGSYNTTNERFDKYYEEYDNNLNEYRVWLGLNTDYVYPQDSHTQALLRQYKCAAMDTDKAIAKIIENLKEKNLHENTTIVMFADHNCYYESLCYTIKDNKKDDYVIDNYNIPFMIYSPKIAPERRQDFVNTYDIYPTICELYGLPYNTMLTHGYNVFSEEISNSFMVSHSSGMFDENYFSLNIKDAVAVGEDLKENYEKFKQKAVLFYEKQHIVERIYKYGLAKTN